jgi:hypothetical protein
MFVPAGILAAGAIALAPPPEPPHFPESAMGVEVVGDQPTYHCRQAAGALQIDGALDEADWKGVAPTRVFRLSHGKGSPARKTRAKALWDDRTLYLAFECDDRDVFSPYTRRDQPLYEGEVVEAFVATGDDPRRYFEFNVSPANVIFDARVVNLRPKGKMTAEPAWNAPGMRSAVRVRGTLNRRGDRDRGWTAEIAIPFVDLGLPRAVRAGDTWRVNLYRIDRATPPEYSAWSPTLVDPPSFHVPDRFGRLVFLDATGSSATGS